jgi:hypothetical protein
VLSFTVVGAYFICVRWPQVKDEKHIVWSDLAEICTITVTYYARYYSKEVIKGSESITFRVGETRKSEREDARGKGGVAIVPQPRKGITTVQAAASAITNQQEKGS